MCSRCVPRKWYSFDSMYWLKKGMLWACLYSVMISLIIYTVLKSLSQNQVVHHERSEDCKLGHVFVGEENTTDTVQTTEQAPESDGYLSVIDDKPLRYHCEQCALVTSSGRLLDKGAGYDIDRGVCVIRMNTAPTEGYEEDVGSTTTIRVVGHTNMNRVLKKQPDLQKTFFEDEKTRANIVIVPWLFYEDFSKEKDESFLVTKEFSTLYPNVSFYYTTPNKVKLAEEIFMNETGITRKAARTWLSTGWMTMLFAIDICDWIDVYGLVNDDYCKAHPNDTTPYHYYADNSKKECWYYDRSENTVLYGHKFLTEKAIFARWAKKVSIYFHYPSWEGVVTNGKHVDTPFLKLYDESKKNGKLRKVEQAEMMKKRIAARRAYLEKRRKMKKKKG
ncbi:alpha-N-acetylgalactosaminide alpha-2,6-sialyltransferase 3-like [Antedon mediterranea]|uniref:alpha-N-acetylgalactosaminide alpha-2,6-sialyltransferase 3-like n=1 Tax=Antedon mediterranea TaxID=105859 RepID=UPI003AF61B01